MAVVAGIITTRVLLAVGDADPMEVATIDTDLHPGNTDHEVVLTSRRWRLSLALGFLRMARGPRQPCEVAERLHTDRQKIQSRPTPAHLPRGPGSSLRR